MPNSTSGRRHAASALLLPAIFLQVLVLAGSGCQPAIEPVYADALDGLPDSHQTQIRDALRMLFGTPANPRMMLPDEMADGEEPEFVEFFDRDHLKHGAAVFNLRCAGCHGTSGDGAGAAAENLRPKPRDYRRGIYKFTSTPYGSKPHRNDLIRVIRVGAKGTSMPAFRFLSDEDMNSVVDYVRMLSYRGELEGRMKRLAEIDYEEDEQIELVEFADALDGIHERWSDAQEEVVLPVSAMPKYSDESILAGRKAFLSRGCAECHGKDFRGQTIWLDPEFIATQDSLPEAEREKINYDAWGDPAPAANLTAKMLHGGRRPLDIYRRIYTGINGTPMPSFQNALAAEPETFWHLVNYVRSVVDSREVAGLDEVKADPIDTSSSSASIDNGPASSAGAEE